MLTRVRIEASDKTSDGVRDELMHAVSLVRDLYGGEWSLETEEVQTTKDGYWGRVTMRLAGAPSAKRVKERNGS